jgi:hypothetical protein
MVLIVFIVREILSFKIKSLNHAIISNDKDFKSVQDYLLEYSSSKKILLSGTITTGIIAANPPQ